MRMGKPEEEDKDKKREEAIASAPSLRPNFKAAGVTQEQLSKFQAFSAGSILESIKELHRKRLKLKTKLKIDKKSKDGTKRLSSKVLDTTDSQETDPNTRVEDSNVPNVRTQSKDNPSEQQDNSAVQLTTKKRQKLHWGLDTKERWERKANM